jgi:hypothetical protein
MNRSRIVAVSVLVVCASVSSAVACSDRTADSARIVQPSSSRSRGAISSAGEDVDGDAAKRAFHANNRHDWVGIAHNQAIDQFRARLRRGVISHDICNDLVAFMSEETRLPEQARRGSGSREQRARIATRSLQATAFCAGRLAASGGGSRLFLAQSTDISAATQALLDQIQAAAAWAPTSGDLAIALNPIIQSAAQLPNGEAEIVLSAASVAQSSMEYWEANLAATRRDYDLAYGDCMGRYGSLDEAALHCLGVTGGGLRPTLYRAGGPVVFQLTQGATIDCNKVKAREIVDDDVKGAIGGAIIGFWTGTAGGPAAPVTAPSGALSGALLGAGGASIGTFTWQWAQTTYCVLSGGGGPARGVEPT